MDFTVSSVSSGAPERLTELAYDAAKDVLKMQDTTLGNLRTRASGVLTTATLLTSFSAALGLMNIDPDRGAVLPAWGAWLLLAVLIGLGVLVLFVLWPVKVWHFAPSPIAILELADGGETESATRRRMADQMIAGMEQNAGNLKSRQTAFRWSAGLMLLEVIVLVAALTI